MVQYCYVPWCGLMRVSIIMAFPLTTNYLLLLGKYRVDRSDCWLVESEPVTGSNLSICPGGLASVSCQSPSVCW